jgi:hypothetical protein
MNELDHRTYNAGLHSPIKHANNRRCTRESSYHLLFSCMILFNPELQIAKGDFGTVPTISLSWEIMQAKMARYASEI